MRILEVEVFGRGGLAHYVSNLSQALATRGHQVTLVTAADYELEGQGSPTPNLRIVERTGRVAGKFRNAHTHIFLRAVRRIEAVLDAIAVARIARRLRPDVIHLHSTNSIAVVYLALFRMLRRPVATTAHVVTPHESMRLQRTIYGSIHAMADLVIAHSEFDRRRLHTEFGVDDDRLAVISHGEYGFFERTGEISSRQVARQSLNLEDDQEVALFFGYIREYKGLDILLEAWPVVAEARPNARLVIAGDPVQLSPERSAELQAWAERVGALHRFDYIPFSEVSRYFSAADLLVMPYRRISQSGVLFLALSLGVPVLATSVGGISEMLEDESNALLIEPESTSSLARALIRALGDPGLQQRLADGGRQVAARYSWDSIAQETETAFRRITPLSR